MTANISDFSKYKRCRTKQYTVHLCVPPPNTFIIDKAENSKLYNILHGKNMITLNDLQIIKERSPELAKAIYGTCKYTTKIKPIVIMGTSGQYWVISMEELVTGYTFQDNTMISIESLKRLYKNGCIDWKPIISKINSNAMALHIPISQRFTTELFGIKLSVNNSGLNHGKGDFIVIDLDAAGRPIASTIRVVNGIQFRENYDNRGWTDCLDLNYQLKVETPKSIIDERLSSNNNTALSKLLDAIEQILKQCESDATTQLKFGHKRDGNKIIVKSTVIESYAKDNAIKDEKSGKSFICKNLETHIGINKEERNLELKYYNVYDSGNKLSYIINIPINGETLNYLSTNRYVIFGLMGYVKRSARNYFMATGGNYTKAEYDGMEYYTISSSGMNRINRGFPKESEKHGEYRADLIRAINNVDSYLNKTKIVKDIQLFRGIPAGDVCKFAGCTWENMEGAVLPDTAFMSTSLNASTAPMFSQTSWYKDSPNPVERNGVVIALTNNIGVNAAYVHDIAGWKEQFEVTVDRRYDIKLGKIITEFKRLKGIVRVIEGRFVPHNPYGKIGNPSLVGMGFTNFNEIGKVSFEKEVVENELHAAFNLLRGKGYTALLYKPDSGLNGMGGNFDGASVVAPSDSGEEIVTDTAYTITSDAASLYLLKYNITGPRKQLRSYWSDPNRNAGVVDFNFAWSLYNINDKQLMDKCQFAVANMKPINDTSAKYLAGMIAADLKFSKDIMLFPLQDIARYFNQVFAENIVFQGYELKGSMPVNRIGKVDNPQDGYVPLKFLIDGDNDDSLLITMKLSRNSNKDLVIQYSGRSHNNKVNESKESNYNTFNSQIAMEKAQEILQSFADKLDLSCTARFKRVINNWCVRRGYKYNTLNINDNNRPGEHRELYEIMKNTQNGLDKYFVLVNKFNTGLYKIGIGRDNRNMRWMQADSHLDILSLCRIFDNTIKLLNMGGAQSA